jgi:hypothetical protein
MVVSHRWGLPLRGRLLAGQVLRVVVILGKLVDGVGLLVLLVPHLLLVVGVVLSRVALVAVLVALLIVLIIDAPGGLVAPILGPQVVVVLVALRRQQRQAMEQTELRALGAKAGVGVVLEHRRPPPGELVVMAAPVGSLLPVVGVVAL